MKKPNCKTNQHNSDHDSHQGLPPSPPVISPKLNADDAQSHDKDSCNKNIPLRTGIKDWIMVLATIVIAVATTVYTVIAHKQWTVMSQTLKEMQNSGKESTTQTDRIIKEANRIADSAADTARQSKKSLDATVDNFRLEQRAWIGTVEVFPAEYDDNGKKVYAKEGQPVKGGTYIMNTGKTPARNLYSLVSLQCLKSGVELIPKYKVVGTQQPSVTASKPTNGVMQPGMKLALSPLPIEGIATKADIDDLTSGRYVVYLTGTITYDDVFDRPHKTTFCMYLKPNLTTFSACSTGNESN